MTDAIDPLALGRAWLRQAMDPIVLARLASAAALTVTLLVTASILPAVLATFLGLDSFVVNGGSMSPAVREGALVISRRTDPQGVRSGDVITYRHLETPNVPVTHRVVDVLNDKDGLRFQTKGDANLTPDPEMVSGALPVSKMVFAIPFAGTVLRFARSTPGHITLLLSLIPLLLSMRGPMRQAGGVVVDAARRRPTPIGTAMPSAMFEAARPVARAITRAMPAPAQRSATPQTAEAAAAPGWMQSLAGRLTARRDRAAIEFDAMVSAAKVASSQRVTAAAHRAQPAEVAMTHLSPRMEHITALLEQQAQMHAEIGEAIFGGMAVVGTLIAQHERTRAIFEAQLDQRLRPALEYADTLEANLDHLMEQLEAAGTQTDPVLTAQFVRDRARAAEVRAQAERSKEPIRAWLGRESEAMDALLAVFDPDVAAIEARLTEQRRDLARIASGLRSDYLGVALTFVQERADEVRGLAERGVTDAAAVEAALRTDAERAREQSRTSPHLARVLAILSKGQAVAADVTGGVGASGAMAPAATAPVEGTLADTAPTLVPDREDDDLPAWVAA